VNIKFEMQLTQLLQLSDWLIPGCTRKGQLWKNWNLKCPDEKFSYRSEKNFCQVSLSAQPETTGGLIFYLA